MSVENHFNQIASDYDYYKKKNSFYYKNLKKLLKELIPKGKNVLEVGCGTGDLLNCLRPKQGYGIDISLEMIKRAKVKHHKSNISFSTKRVSDFKGKTFDYIFMCDVVEHLENPKEMFKDISNVMTKDTIFICTMANPIWEPVLMLAERLNLKMPEGEHYRWSYNELRDKLLPRGVRIFDHDFRLLMPKDIPFITSFINKNFENIFKKYAFIEYVQVCKR